MSYLIKIIILAFLTILFRSILRVWVLQIPTRGHYHQCGSRKQFVRCLFNAVLLPFHAVRWAAVQLVSVSWCLEVAQVSLVRILTSKNPFEDVESSRSQFFVFDQLNFNSRCTCDPTRFEAHHLKGGDFLRLAPHTFCSMLPKVEDPVVREHFQRTGLVNPDQIHASFWSAIDKNVHGKLK